MRATDIARCTQGGTHKMAAYVESDGITAGGRKYAYSGWEIVAPKCGIFDRFVPFIHVDYMREYYIVRTYFRLDYYLGG